MAIVHLMPNDSSARHPARTRQKNDERQGKPTRLAGSNRSIPLTERRPGYALPPFMKVVSSIKSAKKRHPACQVVRRKGKIYVINKVEPRYKARQG